MGKRIRKTQLSTFQIIIFSFFCVIMIGTGLLMLPIASAEHCVTKFQDALFTATSATCVTGLVVHDTGTYWSVFGQIIILIMIQIGGLGIVTAATVVAIVTGKKIGLKQRSTMQEAIAADNVGGVIKLTSFSIRFTFVTEIIGMVLLCPAFVKEYGPLRGTWFALFHSISAFCNAGFDLQGINQPYMSLTAYTHHPLINVVIMLLIVVGGIGFLTWNDILVHKHHFSKYRMQTKVVLVTSGLLIAGGAIYFFFAEWTNLPLKDRIWGALFHSVATRTAGFNTLDLAALSEVGLLVTIVFMMIGGSPGSTAGGMKTTTLAVLLASARAVFKQQEDSRLFKRRLPSSTVRHAAVIFSLYVGLSVVGCSIISKVDGLPLVNCLFETVSAIGTVGLSIGITGEAGIISRTILIMLMFFGRVGGLTLIFAALSNKKEAKSKLPQERIIVG